MSTPEVTFIRQQFSSPSHVHMFKTARDEKFNYFQLYGKQVCDNVQSALSRGTCVEELYETISTAFDMFSSMKTLLEQQISEKNMYCSEEKHPVSIPLNLTQYYGSNNLGRWVSPQLNLSHLAVGVANFENSKSSQTDTAYTLSLLGENFGTCDTNTVKRRKFLEPRNFQCDPLVSLTRLKDESTVASKEYHDQDVHSPCSQTSHTDSNSSDDSYTINETVFIQESDPPDSRRKRGRKKLNKTNLVCELCQTTETPEWRRGPNGPATLCNACGIRYANKKKRDREVRMKGSICRIVDPLVS